MFLSLCLFAVTPVSCSCLLSLKTARGLVHLICFAPLCWRKRGANPPQLAICTGSCLQSSAERLWRVDMSTLRMGFVEQQSWMLLQAAGCSLVWWRTKESCQAKPCCHTGGASGTRQDALVSYHSSNAKSMPTWYCLFLV